MSGILLNIFLFLCAVCIMVPLAGRFRLGSVVGYLVAGVLLGPFGLSLIGNPQEIMHFAEIGVVMMLFVIGLELEPEKLRHMRRSFWGLGGGQMMGSTLAICALCMILGWTWQVSLACGLALSLSSTALVLQLLQEKGLMNSAMGESSFAVLLFQDIAVIPILVFIPLLAPADAEVAISHAGWLASMPAWLRAEVVLGVIVAMVAVGRYGSARIFRLMADTRLREVFLATSLALVTGINLLMQSIGLSPALGAFIAGLVLATSEYKHTLQADIEPFKSLLLGLFFLSVGMGMDFNLMALVPMEIFAGVVGLLLVKMAVLFALGRHFGLRSAQNVLFTFAMSQGGEFAFVLLQFASDHQVFTTTHAAKITLVVALSMAATPFLMLLADRFVIPRFMSVLPEREADEINEKNAVIIAGYGRFGQIIGRFLRAQDVPVTVLEVSAEQVDLLHKFGAKGYFGDASRLDLLRNAGAETARVLVVAVDNPEKALEIVRLAQREFPNLKIFARARNRRHAYELHKAGADNFVRETFDSSLRMAVELMVELGHRPVDMARKAGQFREHDENMLRQSFAFFEQEPELISFSRQASQELERILRGDIVAEAEEEAKQAAKV